jgi:hypothetical protein
MDFSIDHQSYMAQILSLWTCRVAVEKIELSAKTTIQKKFYLTLK